MHYLKIAEENRRRMLEQGLDPQAVLQYLEMTAELQRANFEIIKPVLSPADQDFIQYIMSQGELLLSIVRRSATAS